MNQKPTIGRIVLAVIPDSSGATIVRPAIISRIWNNTQTVQAVVFTDPANDGLGAVAGKSSLQYDPSGKLEHTWHWPPREVPSDVKPECTLESLHSEAVALCHLIEKIPASTEATNAVIAASALAAKIQQRAYPKT